MRGFLLATVRGHRARAPGVALTAFAALLGLVHGAAADRVRNGTAVFSGLDKITGRIISFEAAMGETVQFGSLKITARACFTRPPTETPQTTTFTEVDEASAGNDDKRIFSGWMYASSPGLHGIEHPIYDVWVTGCKNPGETIVDAPETAEAEQPPSAATPDATAPDAAASAAVAPPPPKLKRVFRPAPRPVAAQQPTAEPTQKFFPAFQYPTDTVARDPAGNSRR